MVLLGVAAVVPSGLPILDDDVITQDFHRHQNSKIY